ncbi:cysteine desulfurase family protein (TIGR01976 family) [Tamaricihabitans halophyticus]|uniref:Cysteine desulfurase family protein (TIGR01976 family) n=1 Tax=Tamaricihabitans halophyticus TaxID=1262583 RepID=A0A4R2R2W9_9PSEU|nr:cysteine desulfurase-like protein [Tamaricihabitans halophyticus]TCP56357.1 cysteine desulfurase family protein (TIGR01976 family) [Tamaricihabitans halophyticus]
MKYNINSIRGDFPALDEGAAHFDGPGGVQVPRQVADAVAQALCSAIANRGTVTAAEHRAEGVVHAARAAMADLLGVTASGIVFGRSMTQLTYDFARTLSKDWLPGDEIVVTRLDHDANIRPWVHAAEPAGVAVRWADFDAASGVLAPEAIAELLTDRTRLVAVTGASNLLGSRPDVARIAELAKARGALVYVDGVHLTPHLPVDVTELGADFFACSPYKFLGPHHGVVAAEPALLDTLRPDKLLPATDEVPERFELGTLPYELLAGTTAAVDFLAGVCARPNIPRRHQITASMQALAEHEEAMHAKLEAGLANISGIQCYGAPDRVRTPTTLFSVAGVPSPQVHKLLAERRVNAPAGSFYAVECSRWLGLGDGGAVRAGIAPYTNESDVDRLLEALTEIAENPSR